MTSLVSRKLHMLLPRITRAGEMCKTKGRVRLSSTLVVRSDLAKLVVMMGGDMKPYSTSLRHNAAAVPMEQAVEATADGLEKRKRVVKSQKEEVLDRMLYKLDLDLRRTGRVVSYELEKVVKMIEVSGVCTANQALLLLRCCGDVLVDLDRKTRNKMVERYIQILEKSGVTFDVSHYNAILRVHLENEKEVSAPEFLSEMEAAGITPNRVTFQHLVGLYCVEGNIMGATTILEHMKAQDMPISEAVFISLLKGHCANNDTELITSTLELMTSSGLGLGVETYLAMACSYGKVGNWSKVEEVLSKADNESVKFDDGDILSIILACSQGGLHEEAHSLVSRLPKKRGYYQMLINHLPQLAMSGNVNTAVDLYLTLNTKGGEGREQMGKFMVGPLVRSGVSGEDILQAVNKMEEAGYSTSLQHLVHEAAYVWSQEKCLKLMENVKKEKDGALNFDKDGILKFLRFRWQDEKDTEKMFDCLNNLHSMGLFVPFTFVENDLLPTMLNLDSELPSQVIGKLVTRCPFINRDMAVSMVLYSLFNTESPKGLSAATGFLLNISCGFVHPVKWNAPLARAYLKTKSVEDLITILFINSREKVLGRDPVQAASHVFKVLEFVAGNASKYKTSPETVLTPVLEELVRLHIGVPSSVVNTLKEELKSDEIVDLLDKAALEWDNREAFWTVETIAGCFNDRKKLHWDRMSAEGGNLMRTANKYRGYFKIPESMEGMEEIQEVLAGRGDVSPTLSDKLIFSYTSAGMIDKAVDLIKYTKKNKSDFDLSPSAHVSVVKALVDLGRVEEALDLLEQKIKSQNTDKAKPFVASLLYCLEGLAKQGKDKMVLEMINNCDRDNFLTVKNYNNTDTRTGSVLSVYSSKGDVKMVQEIFNALTSAKLSTHDDIVNLNALVEVHMVGGDLKGAVAEFGRIARVYKKLPKKYDLTYRLIEEEDIEAMQEVLDTSIEVAGEEKSLYHLAFCFLDTGRITQARKLLETPGLRYNEENFKFQCNILKRDNRPQVLEDLVSISRNIFGCDRNMLYQQLVSAYKEDADKVSDIWVQVQEEGFPPSDSLKIEIARALKAAGKPLPFEEPLEVAEQSVQENSKVDNTSKNTVEMNTTSKNTVEMINEEVITALNMKDFNTVTEMVMDSFEKGNTSLGCKKKVIDSLTKEDRIEEASKIAIRLAQGFQNPNNIRFKELYINIINKLGEDKKQEFRNNLSPAFVEKLDAFKSKSTPKQEAKAVVSASDTDKFAGDAVVREALQKNDMTGVVDGVEKLQVSIGCRNEILKELLENNKLDDAAKVLTTDMKNRGKSNNRTLVPYVCDMFKKWEDGGEVFKTVEFLKDVGQNLAILVRGDIWVKSGLARTDTSGYINLVKEHPDDHKKWLINSDVLAEAVDKNPALVSTLESLAAEGFVPANILLSKLSIMRQDAEQFEKHINFCPTNLKISKFGGIFDKIDTTEKMDMVLAVLKRNNSEVEVVNRVVENFKLHSEPKVNLESKQADQ